MAGYDRSLYQSYLCTVPMFRSCTTEQLDRLARLGDALAFTDGKDIVREGSAGDAFYILASGEARVTRDGREVGALAQGDYFGELALFDPAPRNATVTADGTVSCIALSRDAFTEALNETPAIRDALLHGMAHRLHELDERA